MGIDDDADLDLRPMDPPPARAKQSNLPIDAPRPEFGQPLDTPRTRKRAAAPASPVDEDKVGDYRHADASRTNIPEAGLATQDRTPTERVTYAYDPHLDPQLVWAGKAEHTSFDIDTVSLHIHERASTAAILRAVRREEVQRTLFSDPVMSVDQELDFYQHEFPQVLSIVRRYVETKIDRIGGAELEEIALEPYRSTIESRIRTAIRPADEDGEQPFLPVLHDMAGVGSTDITPFLTIKTCVDTVRSHLSKAVVDSGWERTVARALDESERVHSWVKNARLDFTIPYEHQGRKHDFIPDFIVDLRDAMGARSDEHLVVEVKGLEREADRSKDVGAQRWVAAVNHWGKLGRWRYAKLHSPHDLVSVLGDDPGPGSGTSA